MSSLLVLTFVVFLSGGSLAQQLNSACFYESGNYRLEWNIDANDMVHFNLTYRNFPPGNYWTGVSFGQNMSAGMDVILVISTSNGVSTADAHVMGYQPPTLDPKNDVITDAAQLSGGTLRVQFSRPLGTNEGVMYDMNLDGCVMWHFVVGTGGMTTALTPTKHSTTPLGKQVCDIKRQCVAPVTSRPNTNQQQNTVTIRTTPRPAITTTYRATVMTTGGQGCSNVDPDWCRAYVIDYLVWQQTYNRLSIPQACVPLMNSLLFAPSRCCQNLRVNGC